MYGEGCSEVSSGLHAALQQGFDVYSLGNSVT